MSPAATRGSTEFVERFWRNVRVDPLGCWIWTAGKSKGYGVFGTRGKYMYAHIFAWELQNKVPSPTNGHKSEFDHLCRNPACINPAHLEHVTHRINNLRGVGAAAQNARKTVCSYGHSLEDAIIEGRRKARRCRECERQRTVGKQKKRHALLRAGLTRDGNPRRKRLRSNVQVMAE